MVSDEIDMRFPARYINNVQGSRCTLRQAPRYPQCRERSNRLLIGSAMHCCEFNPFCNSVRRHLRKHLEFCQRLLLRGITILLNQLRTLFVSFRIAVVYHSTYSLFLIVLQSPQALHRPCVGGWATSSCSSRPHRRGVGAGQCRVPVFCFSSPVCGPPTQGRWSRKNSAGWY